MNYKAVEEKRKALRQLYGGVMSPADLDRELGYKKRGGGVRWAEMVGLEPIPLSSNRKGYETDLVAKQIVMLRGMG